MHKGQCCPGRLLERSKCVGRRTRASHLLRADLAYLIDLELYTKNLFKYVICLRLVCLRREEAGRDHRWVPLRQRPRHPRSQRQRQRMLGDAGAKQSSRTKPNRTLRFVAFTSKKPPLQPSIYQKTCNGHESHVLLLLLLQKTLSIAWTHSLMF